MHGVISLSDATSYDKYRLLYGRGVSLGHIGTRLAISVLKISILAYLDCGISFFLQNQLFQKIFYLKS